MLIVNLGPLHLYLGTSLTYLILHRLHRQVGVLPDRVLTHRYHRFSKPRRVHGFDLLVRKTQLNMPSYVFFARCYIVQVQVTDIGRVPSAWRCVARWFQGCPHLRSIHRLHARLDVNRYSFVRFLIAWIIGIRLIAVYWRAVGFFEIHQFFHG